MKKITVFTPTYNRAYILGQAYESLKNQTDKNFIWLIVDDGSTDNTEQMVKNWNKECAIEIQYIKQQNQGKHIAHNTAVINCTTEFILILDSDDFLANNAIEVLNKEVKKISNNSNISGIIGNRFNAKTKQVIGTYITKKVQYASGLELYQKYGFKGDTLRLYKTNILKKNLFPQIKNERFIYENVVFDKIDNQYKMLINTNELYFGEYLENGYTKNANKIKKENPVGYALSLKSSEKYSLKKIEKLKYKILYIIWCRRYDIKFDDDIKINKLILLIAKIFEKIKFPKFFYQ